MYKKQDLRVLQILQKAREFADSDLLNESLVSELLKTQFPKLSSKEKEEIMLVLNSIISSKEKALLSNK